MHPGGDHRRTPHSNRVENAWKPILLSIFLFFEQTLPVSIF